MQTFLPQGLCQGNTLPCILRWKRAFGLKCLHYFNLSFMIHSRSSPAVQVWACCACADRDTGYRCNSVGPLVRLSLGLVMPWSLCRTATCLCGHTSWPKWFKQLHTLLYKHLSETIPPKVPRVVPPRRSHGWSHREGPTGGPTGVPGVVPRGPRGGPTGVPGVVPRVTGSDRFPSYIALNCMDKCIFRVFTSAL